VKRNKIFIIASLLLVQAMMFSIFGQMTYTRDYELPETENYGAGEVTPLFSIDALAETSAGYDIENGSYGIKDLNSAVNIRIRFVDSINSTPKETAPGAGADDWTGMFSMKNYSLNLVNDDFVTKEPIWLGKIVGKGYEFGFMGQASKYIRTAETAIAGGRQVLYFNDPDVVDSDFYTDFNPDTETVYDGGTGIVYVGYTQKDLFKTYLSLTSEGNVDTNDKEDANGLAAVLDYYITPFGTEPDASSPFSLAITGNFIGGFEFDSNPLGMGIKVEPSLYLQEAMILTPVVAFDASVPDQGDASYDFSKTNWAMGGGLTLSLSEASYITDYWGEMEADSSDFFSDRYVYGKIRKSSYAQLYASYSDLTDLDLAIKFEEPIDKDGFDENLGSMVEIRMNNLGTDNQGWSSQGWISYALQDHRFTPYMRSYINDSEIVKMRLGSYINIIPRAGFEISYTSNNLNSGSTAVDKGTLEVLVRISTEENAILVANSMDMDDWNE